jgi:endoglucanase
MASGGNDVEHIDSSPEQEAYVLYGAVVGGPTQGDLFYDIRSDWVETEVGGNTYLYEMLHQLLLGGPGL